ncbi:MMPL family transporter [Sphaerisporangium sp. NPDC051017]|uniref:MMPL family transporter n=1 Tax=Sphaerisporangium sp. NPDC051017 TaxID=3154636 RepID=UPI00343A16EF
MLDVIGGLTTRRAGWVLATWLAVLAAALVTWPEALPGGYGPLPVGPGGAAGTVLALLVLIVVLRSPAAALTAVLAAVAVHCLSAGLLIGLGLPPAPDVFAYGTAAGSATMLAHRVRERLHAAEPPARAVVTALEQVGAVVATSGAAWMAACAALPLGALPRGLGPSLALTSAVQMLVVLTLVPAVLAVLGGSLAWPGRRRTGPPTALARLGRAVVARPGAWTAVTAALILAMGATGPVLEPEPLPFTVMAVAGVLVALVLALVLRSLVAPIYVTTGGLLVAWAAGTAAADPGRQLAVFMFSLVTSVASAVLVLARVRAATRAGRDPRTGSALAVKYAGPPALAALLAAGTLTAGGSGVLSGLCLAAGGAGLALVIVPGLAATLGGRAWWPDTAPEATRPAPAPSPEPVDPVDAVDAAGVAGRR